MEITFSSNNNKFANSLTPVFEATEYEEKTTFGTDFDKADVFGKEAIMDTFEKAFAESKNDYEYLTELVMVLNYKCWQWYNRGNQTISKLYADLYYKTDDYASTHLEGDEWSYYYSTTD